MHYTELVADRYCLAALDPGRPSRHRFVKWSRALTPLTADETHEAIENVLPTPVTLAHGSLETQELDHIGGKHLGAHASRRH